MDKQLKEILVKLVNELEDLRAGSVAMAGHPAMKISPAEAKDAKTNALKVHEDHYKALKREIEAL